jgi:acetyl-CoA acetyltransferase
MYAPSMRTFVIGVGMTKFDKPGSKEGDYPDWAKEAGEKALADAGIPYEDVGQAYAAYCYGDSTYGQRCLYELGMTGIPVINVHNNCSTGSSALFLARQAVMAGIVDCALALGFEKMEKGSLGMKYTDRTPAMDKHIGAMLADRGDWEAAPPAPQMFGNAGREHMERYGSEPDHYAWIGYKNHKHSVNNPYAQFQTEYTLDEIKESREIFSPLTKLQCSPTSDGSGCAIVASERYVDEHDLWDRAVELAGQAMATDFASTFEEKSSIKVCGFDLSKAAAEQALAQAETDIGEVDVIELHDCFSANELITYEALGLAPVGEGHKLVEAEATTYGGDGPVVNPSGGLISKGHPLGATGLAQCSELVWQLRGTADARQVEGAKVALQHNIGLGGAAVVSVYKAAS